MSKHDEPKILFNINKPIDVIRLAEAKGRLEDAS